MAEHYGLIDDTKVVLSIRGQQAIQHVSDAELRRCGQQVIRRAAAGTSAQEEPSDVAPCAAGTSVAEGGEKDVEEDDDDIEVR